MPNPKSPSDAPSRERSDEALRWIVRLNSGEATRADHEAYAAWRAADPENDGAAREAQDIWRDASGLGEDRATGALRPDAAPGAGFGGASRRKLLGVAALAAAAGAAGWETIGGRSAFAGYATGRGETRETALADGSRISLDARSALDAAGRSARLIEGEAAFEIAEDRMRPFHVVAGNVEIVTDGAAFVVDASRPDGGAAISVLERRVRLSTASTPPFELGAPNGVVVDRAGRVGPARAVDRAAATAWRDGRLVAEDSRLDEVAARLARHHRGWIVVRDDVAPLKVSVVLDLRTPDASLDALAAALPIAITRLSPYLAVVGRA